MTTTYIVEGFLCNLCPCLDIAFAQLGVIKFVEIVDVVECCLIITDVQSNESKKQLFRIYHPVKVAYRIMSVKKEKLSSYLIYNIISLSKMAGKTEPFS